MSTHTDNFAKGDILKGNRKLGAVHRIVYLSEWDHLFFLGAMVTHSDQSDNILMSEEHFWVVDQDNKRFEFQFENTYMVRARLFKRQEWGPFDKVGELTEKGIAFVEANLPSREPRPWEEYLDDNSAN